MGAIPSASPRRRRCSSTWARAFPSPCWDRCWRRDAALGAMVPLKLEEICHNNIEAALRRRRRPAVPSVRAPKSAADSSTWRVIHRAKCNIRCLRLWVSAAPAAGIGELPVMRVQIHPTRKLTLRSGFEDKLELWWRVRRQTPSSRARFLADRRRRPVFAGWYAYDPDRRATQLRRGHLGCLRLKFLEADGSIAQRPGVRTVREP